MKKKLFKLSCPSFIPHSSSLIPSLHVLVVGLVTALGVLVGGAVETRARTGPAPVLQKVEPPSWWAGHTINPVRLLVRGTNLRGARVSSARTEISAGAPRINNAGTYLFVNVTISPKALPGDYPLTLETEAGRASIPFRLNTSLNPKKNFQGVTNDDVIYLIMPDRFSNGDSSNDVPKDAPAAASDR